MSATLERRPRIGVPWRTAKQERAGDTRYYRDYLVAVRDAGGDPVKVSLLLPPRELAQLAKTLDAVVLPGSPADVAPKRYRGKIHNKNAPADVKRENTDIALLTDAFAAGKPVLAICYGTQLLNVYLGGTLVQDIPTELAGKVAVHGKVSGAIKHDHDSGDPATLHTVRLTRGRLAKLARHGTVRVNSSHHQSILRPGRGLRVTALASDGVVEAVEGVAGPQWVVGVQWHPERMRRPPKANKSKPMQPKDGAAKDGRDGVALAKALFSTLVVEARIAAKRSRSNLRGRGALHVESGSRKRPQ